MRPKLRTIAYPIRQAFTSIAIMLCCLSTGPGALATGTPAHPATKMYRIGFMDSNNKALFLHDFKGKPVIVNLWASWCAPCVEEMPSLAKLQDENRSKGLVVLALSEDDSMAQAIAFYKAKSITSLMPLFDKNHMAWLALTQSAKAEERGIPVTVLINRAGVPVKTYAGPVNWQSLDMQQQLQALLQ